jgi:hypothetical protein
MIFLFVLISTTLAIAGSAAFFSVYGMAQIFSGAFWPIVIMFSSLEAGKLVAASYVYRFWGHITFSLKAYLLTAILVLMAITSVGVFGFLSAAYQKDILPLEQMTKKIELLDKKAASFEEMKRDQILQRQKLDDQKAAEIAALPPKYATKKKEVAERFAPRIAAVEANIAQYNEQARAILEEKSELELSTLTQELKTGPIIFIAAAFGREVDDATKWLILIIIFAFDPLAVALTVGANIAIVERQTHHRRRKDDRKHMMDEILNEIPDDEEEPVITESDKIEAILNHPAENITIEQIQNALHDMQEEESPQKTMLEEMLRRKKITERIRNPKSSG